jgi:D-alanyl-D-alanine carboxypeptidase/D-alanyl-D-alanine-endopeptidase (penicillin-binding protein 4)
MRAIARALLLPLAFGGCALLRPSSGPSPSGNVRRARASLTHAIDSMVNMPAFRNAHWGVLIVDPLAGDTLYSHNATKLFIPASNQKLIASTVALEQIGPDFRFRTVIAARGRVAGEALAGDLAIIGRGDPTVSDRMRGDAMIPLRAIADSLWERGIRRITGTVVAVGNAFPGSAIGSGWPYDGLDGGSFAAVDELLFNEGLSSIRVRAGLRVGDVAVAETRPSRTYPVTRVEAVTVPRDTAAAAGGGRGGGRGGRGGGGRGGTGTRLSAQKDTAASVVVVRGQVALGDSAMITVTHPDPNAAYLAALTEALRERGIAVERQSLPTASQQLDSLFTMVSVTLREILPHLMKPSQNQIAEVFLKTIGLERTGIGTADSGRRVAERQFEQWKLPPDGYVVRDGSGLSRNDLITPEAVVGLLDVMRRSPNFDLFYASLPVAGVDGTIGTRLRDTPAQGNVHAKTGTLSMVRSLSGYVRTADGRLLEFSILCNNWTVPQADVDRVADAIAVSLAQLRLR